jgi:hypothetical protein
MYELSYANIDFLKKEVCKSGITLSHLQDELIDHLCCDVEAEMSNGIPFEKAYDMVIQKIGYHGLQQIQEDTLYLIDKNYRIMKNTMKITGLIAPVLMSFGALFKIMHWPGAGIMLVLGFFLLCFFFIPSALYVSFKEISNKTKKFTYISIFFGTFFLAASFLFKVMHWPMANIIFVIGMFFICILFLPSLIFQKKMGEDPSVPRSTYILAFVGFIMLLLGFAFKMMHCPGASMLFIVGSFVFVIIALPIYTYQKYKHSEHIENSFIFIIIVLVWFITPITLITLNVTRNLLNTNYQTENIYLQDINYYKERNNILYEKIPVNEKTTKIKNETDAILDLIEARKIKTENDLNSTLIMETKIEKLNSDYINYRLDLEDAGKSLPVSFDFSLHNTQMDVNNILSLIQLDLLIAESEYFATIKSDIDKKSFADNIPLKKK